MRTTGPDKVGVYTRKPLTVRWCSEMCQIRVLIKASLASRGAGTEKSFLLEECLALGKGSSFEKQQETDLDYSRSQNNVSA